MRQPAIPKLSDLSTAQRAELVAIWTATLGEPPQFRASRELLAAALACQLQERKFGGLSPATKRKLGVLARGALERKQRALAAPPPVKLRPGTAILKQWRGAQHLVMVLDEGFQYQGAVYRSLSQIARKITGTRWNGPAFFGLRKGHRRPAEVGSDGK